MSELLHSPDAELAALKARVARLERLEEQCTGNFRSVFVFDFLCTDAAI